MSTAQLTEAAFDELDELFVGWDHDEGVLERLEDFVAKTPPRTYGNSDDLLDAFAKRERRARWVARARHFVAQWSWAATLTVFVGALWANTAGWLKVTLGVAVLMSFVALAWSFVGDAGSYLTVGAVDELRRKRDTARSPGASPC
jgi:hypothetical protein